MNQIHTIGIDLAKNVIHACAVDKNHQVVCRKKYSRLKMLAWLNNLSPCLIGIEACGGSHFWCRKLTQFGHRVKLMSPQFVKPYVKSNKNDMNDAEAICEAVTRPNMRFVSPKSIEQQDVQSIHRIRSRLVGQRTALVNQIRGLMNEYGYVLPQGISSVRRRLPDLVSNDETELTDRFKALILSLYDELCDLDRKVRELDIEIENLFRQSEACRRIGKLPGIGPLTATALVANIGDATVYKNGREMAAWLGLVPRQFSTGGKARLGGISKRGDTYLRTLLVHGGRAVVRTAAKRTDRHALWAQRLTARKGVHIAAVAVANKNARLAWALLAHGTEYSPAMN